MSTGTPSGTSTRASSLRRGSRSDEEQGEALRYLFAARMASDIAVAPSGSSGRIPSDLSAAG